MKTTKAEDIAFEFGFDAAMEGEPRESNPYETTYYLHKWWDLGWIDYTTIMNEEVLINKEEKKDANG